MINFHNTDNMKFMADVPDKYYDLAIVDPPYGIGESGATNKTRGKLAKAKDYFKDSVNRFKQYKSQQTIQF